jgi:hypothetical protein
VRCLSVPAAARLLRAAFSKFSQAEQRFVAVVTFLKGKLLFGMVSVFLPLDGIWGAVRLAKPRSLWAKWFYRSHPEQMTKAHVRLGASDARVKRFHEWFDDLLGGHPSIGLPAMTTEIVGGRLMMKGLHHGRPDTGESDRELA